MKTFNYLAMGLICLMALTSGCRRKPTSLTYVPGQTRNITNEVVAPRDDSSSGIKSPTDDKATAVVPNPNTGDMDKTGGVALPERSVRDNFTEDREFFKNDTVYFAFDSATIKVSERPKLDAVAAALKSKINCGVEIEGHCDERGTEEYNRALGERRALSTREYLINLGISGERIFTISFGEDKPAVDGHNEPAWTKNRRAEFILLNPK